MRKLRKVSVEVADVLNEWSNLKHPKFVARMLPIYLQISVECKQIYVHVAKHHGLVLKHNFIAY
jgi:hypothetical protein